MLSNKISKLCLDFVSHVFDISQQMTVTFFLSSSDPSPSLNFIISESDSFSQAPSTPCFIISDHSFIFACGANRPTLDSFGFPYVFVIHVDPRLFSTSQTEAIYRRQIFISTVTCLFYPQNLVQIVHKVDVKIDGYPLLVCFNKTWNISPENFSDPFCVIHEHYILKHYRE